MKLKHPVTGGKFVTTEKSYENAWKAKGWVPDDDPEPENPQVPEHDSGDEDLGE